MPHPDSIVLVGPPNSGKTTLFNWLTGYKARIVNYPGSTVDYCQGQILKKYSLNIHAVDTPGIYSLFPKNPSEEITNKILYEFPIKMVVVTMDVLRIHRQLPLALSLKEAGFNVVIALTMWDLVSRDHCPDLQKFSKKIGIPVLPIEGKLGKGVLELAQEVKNKITPQNQTPPRKDISWLISMQDQFFQKTDSVIQEIFKKSPEGSKWSQTLDKFLLHPFFGIVSFAAIMITLFSSIFWLAAPAMDLVDIGFSFLSEKIQSFESSLFIDFLSNGVITSFAAVLIFVPQIFILFLGIGILEDTGYLARSASLMDVFFSKVGLSGRSFVPFLAGYACAIPACLAARNITSRKERWIVIAVIPLLTCSARLPVYALLLSFFFYGDSAWKAGFWMSIIYILSMVMAILASFVLHKLIQKTKRVDSPFVMELPAYKRPLLLGLLSSSWRRTAQYVRGAGPLIFMFALLVWGATHFPRNLDLSESEQIEKSYAGQFGKKIEPVFELMGGDWRVGTGLLSAFVAREVFVSTLALLFQVTEEGSDETIKHSLLKKMKQAENKRGDPVFTPLSIFVLILFFMISLQCLSTTAIVKKETGSNLFALSQLLILNFAAYFVCVVIYQVSLALF